MDTDIHLTAADAERAQAAKLAHRTEAADMAWLMSGPRGRRIVWRALERAGVFRTSYSSDALAMAFAEGARNEGLRLLAAVQHLPEYSLMAPENTTPAQAEQETLQ